MRFTVSTKPLKNVTDLGIIKANISKFYYRSNIVQITATRDTLKLNIEASGIKSRMTLSGSGDSDTAASVLVECAKFKNLICGKILEVTESKEILDRVWDNEKVAWKRNADETFASQKKIAFRFEPKNLPNAAVATAATNKLMEHYESDPICKEFINVDEAE